MRIPDNTQRVSIYGMTGTGKTVAAEWHLSQRDFTERPWVILDFKGDSHIAQIHAKPLPSGSLAPGAPGIYVARPVPDVDEEWVEDLLWSMWRRGEIGLYVDEGYMVGQKSKAFNAILTQGRSKEIPVITLSQRPVWLSRFVISEADFHQVFFLADSQDRDIVQRFIPYDITERRLPKYHSYYYDVAEDRFLGLKPVPKPSVIRQVINDRLDALEEPHVVTTTRPIHFI